MVRGPRPAKTLNRGAAAVIDYRIGACLTKLCPMNFEADRISAPVTTLLLRACAIALVAAGTSLAAQQTSFRSSAELVSIDVLATDPQGVPVGDLTAKDFTLKVDGKVRALQSVQLVRLADANRPATTTRTSLASIPSPFATNTDPRGRAFIFAVDQDQIHPGNEKQIVDASIRLLDRLNAEDRVAVVTMPRGRVEADLSTDRAAARAALERVAGHAPRPFSRFEFSIKEALAVYATTAGNDTSGDFSANIITEMVRRECEHEGATCPPALRNDARNYGREIVTSSRDTVRALTEFVSGLAALEGTKSLIFVSERLIETSDVARDLLELGRAADLARVRTFVVQANRPLGDAARRRAPADEAGDISMEMTGLENVAGVTGGQLFRPSGRLDNVMTEIDSATSAYYLIGFEPTEKERDGKYHKIQVTLNRPNVTLRARAGFSLTKPTATTTTAADSSPLASMLRDNIRTFRDLPLRAAAFAFRAEEPGQVKVVVLAETMGTAALDSAAFALISESGGQGAEWVADGKELAGAPLVTAGSVLPGRYRVRMAAADALGRRGVVDVPLDAQLTDAGPLQISGLMAGRMSGSAFQPRFDFVNASEVTGFLEIYNVPLLAGTPTAKLELAATTDGPALDAAAMATATTSAPDRRLAQATLTIPPGAPAGDLILRAHVFLDGRLVGSASRIIRR